MESKSESEDPQRSLTDGGRRTVEQMAGILSLLALALERIEHSGVVRLDRSETGQWAVRWAITSDLLPALTMKERSAA